MAAVRFARAELPGRILALLGELDVADGLGGTTPSSEEGDGPLTQAVQVA